MSFSAALASSSTRRAGGCSSSSTATVAGRAGTTSATPRSGSPAPASSPPASSTRSPRAEDPAGERQADRRAGTFGELADRYREEWSKRRNKSWKQADELVRRHLLPRWGHVRAKEITRANVRAAIGAIKAPIVANQTLAAASAIFSWAVNQEIIPFNPARGVESNPTAKSRPHPVGQRSQIALAGARPEPQATPSDRSASG